MELPVYPDEPTVYFLAHGEQIVYIGQTRSMKKVWAGRRHSDKIYDRLFCVVVDANELDAAETACILYFRPKYNLLVASRKAKMVEVEIFVKSLLKDTGLLEFPRNKNAGPGEKGIHIYSYPRPSVTVDVVVFGFSHLDPSDPLKVLLIQRGRSPFLGDFALPGGYVNVSDVGTKGEDLEHAARRELKEETGIKAYYPAHLEQIATYGSPNRDPRGRVISVAYMVLVPSNELTPVGGSDASAASWVGVNEARKLKLAFDHNIILFDAVKRLRAKIRYAPIGLKLLPETFTLSDLRLLYEGILSQKIDPANFAKRVLDTHILTDTGDKSSTGGRPGKLYRFDETAYHFAMDKGRFNLEFNHTNVKLGPNNLPVIGTVEEDR
jgi:8-oxo-dGTP diphosphatase